jgi:hypothetical protein
MPAVDPQVLPAQLFVARSPPACKHLSARLFSRPDVEVLGVVELFQASVIPPDLFQPKRLDPLLSASPSYHESVVMVAFLQLLLDPAGFCLVTVGIFASQFVHQPPTNRAHEGFRLERFHRRLPPIQEASLQVVLRRVALLTQRDQVPWSVATVPLPETQVVDLQNFTLAFACRVLALVSIPVQDVLAQVPEPGLLPILISNAFDFRIFDPLDIEVRHFNYYRSDKQRFFQPLDPSQVSVKLVLD